jgi:hypothetical protein
MFTKRAQFHMFGVGRGGHSAAPAGPCNDNHSVRRLAANVERMPRRVLGCRWRQTPTGRLECMWHVETADASAAEEPGIGWLIVLALPLLRTCAPFRVRPARRSQPAVM